MFAFKDGYSTANRTARAFFHGVSDVFSLGLWEVIGTPAEAIFSGSEMKVEIAYGPDERVLKATNLLEPARQAAKPDATQPQNTDVKAVSGTEQAANDKSP